jgi:hypothetical protein
MASLGRKFYAKEASNRVTLCPLFSLSTHMNFFRQLLMMLGPLVFYPFLLMMTLVKNSQLSNMLMILS